MSDIQKENGTNPEIKDTIRISGLSPPLVKIREGELASFFSHRTQFFELMQSYASPHGKKADRNKIFGVFYDTIFFVGICSLRGIVPAMKDVYLELDESRSSSLRHIEYLESIGVIGRQTDPADSRRTSVLLTRDFTTDFNSFIQKWIGSPRNKPDRN